MAWAIWDESPFWPEQLKPWFTLREPQWKEGEGQPLFLWAAKYSCSLVIKRSPVSENLANEYEYLGPMLFTLSLTPCITINDYSATRHILYCKSCNTMLFNWFAWVTMDAAACSSTLCWAIRLASTAISASMMRLVAASRLTLFSSSILVA